MSSQHHRRQPEEDIFSIVGGVELEADSHQPQQSAHLQRGNNASSNSLESAAGGGQTSNRGSFGNLSLLGDMAAEEQPSRILFIRGLDATVSDEALVQMFEVTQLRLWPALVHVQHPAAVWYRVHSSSTVLSSICSSTSSLCWRCI